MTKLPQQQHTVTTEGEFMNEKRDEADEKEEE